MQEKMRNLNAKRIVVKIGTSTITKSDGSLDEDFLSGIASQLSSLKDKEIIIVTSGAIGSGATAIGIKTKVRDIKLRQALAAIGQGYLMKAYNDAFSRYNLKVAQLLLTYDDFSDRQRYLNLQHSIQELLKLNVIPVINENDPVSINEIDASFGDNDKLSAFVASKMEADLLIMLSDVNGLYDKNPKLGGAKLIKEVREITREIEAIAGKAGSTFAIGGMRTKLEAAKIAQQAGCNMVIVHGREKDIISRVVKGEEIGTLFLAEKTLNNKQRWILHAKPKGKIAVDEGCMRALEKNSSCLAAGVKKVEGSFRKGDVVAFDNFAKAIVDYSSDELAKSKGKKGIVVAKAENIVFVKK